jgi:hypothetical protein
MYIDFIPTRLGLPMSFFWQEFDEFWLSYREKHHSFPLSTKDETLLG